MKIYQKILFGASAVCAMMIAGCSSGNKDVEEFALSFANKAAANQLDSVRVLYPDAAKADSLSLSFNADSISVSEGEAAGTFLVNYGNAAITVKRGENGKLSVLSSKGLFAYPERRMTFARKTGAVKEGMDDVAVAANISELDSLSAWIYGEYHKSLDGAITAGKPVVEEGYYASQLLNGYVMFTNNTDKDIAAKDWQIKWKYTYMGYEGTKTNSVVEDGSKAIPAHQSVKITFICTGHDLTEILWVKVKAVPMDEYLATYQPTGDEYANYKKTR